MSQFDKYIKIGQEMINESNKNLINESTDDSEMTNRLKLLTASIEIYTKLEKNEIAINDIVLGNKEDGSDFQMIGFASDFSNETQSSKLINRSRQIAKNATKITKTNNIYYKENFQLTDTLVNVLKGLKIDNLENLLKKLDDQLIKDLKNLDKIMEKISNLPDKTQENGYAKVPNMTEQDMENVKKRAKKLNDTNH